MNAISGDLALIVLRAERRETVGVRIVMLCGERGSEAAIINGDTHLVEVAFLQRDARVRLVHVNSEGVLDPLHGEILSHRLELRAYPEVFRAAVLPPLLEMIERLDEHGLGPHGARIRRTREPEVLLLEIVARAAHGKRVHIKLVRVAIRLARLAPLEARLRAA